MAADSSALPADRTVLVSNRLAGVGPRDEEIGVLPNRQAALSLGVPYRSLSSLALRVIEEAGIGVATELVSRRLLERAVAMTDDSGDPAGLARAVEPTLRELIRAGVDLGALEQWPSRRIKRLALIGSAYFTLLRARGLIDGAELLWRAASCPCQRKTLRVSGFPRLPAAERAFIDAISGPGSVVHLPSGPGALLAENREAIGEFERLGWRLEQAPATEPCLGQRLASRWLAQQGGAAEVPGVPPAPTELRAHAYPDLEAEARGTLSRVKGLLAGGTDPRRIAIVARHEEAYGPALLAVADEYGLPLRALYQVPLSQTRLGSWISLLLEVLGDDFPFEATARLLAHPLAGVLGGESWRRVRETHPAGAEAWRRELPTLIAPWPQRATRAEYVRELLATLDRFGVRRRALAWARETLAFGALVDELAALPDGNRDLTSEQFAAEVAELARILTVPAAPGRGGVELHTPLSLFGTVVDHLFLVGAAEGILPSPVRPDPLLDPFEREELQARGHAVEGVVAAARREELSFWALLNSTGRSLTISYPKLLGRSETLPSPFIAQLGLQAADPPRTLICSLQELRRVRLRQPLADEPDADEDVVLEHARHAHCVESTREDERPHDEYDGMVGLPFEPPARGVGVSRVIDLASCPFKFFGASVLRLAEPAEAEIELEASTRGKLYHQVLQSVMEVARTASDPRSAALDALDGAFAAAEEEWGLDRLASWPLERDQHLTTLRRAITGEEFMSPGASTLELETEFRENWRGLPVRGRIDRIDAVEGGIELLDYKSGGGVSNLAKDESGRSTVDLQLPIYREAAAPALAPGARVGSTRYYSVTKAKILWVREPDEAELDRIAGAALASWRQGAYPVEPDLERSACKYCEFDSLCRQGPRLERKRNRQ
jgi:RecB family exonuclease